MSKCSVRLIVFEDRKDSKIDLCIISLSIKVKTMMLNDLNIRNKSGPRTDP